jgi:hypothetical protein
MITNDRYLERKSRLFPRVKEEEWNLGSGKFETELLPLLS